jgi:hypothetical protein
VELTTLRVCVEVRFKVADERWRMEEDLQRRVEEARVAEIAQAGSDLVRSWPRHGSVDKREHAP